MVHAAPRRHAIPESSREKAERLLPELKAGEAQLGEWLDTMAQQIHDAPSHHDRDEHFYRLKTRTDSVLKDLLELAMIPPSSEPSAYGQQQKVKLGTDLRRVMSDWNSWGRQWEATLPNATVTQFDAVHDDTYLNALLAKATAILRRDGRIDTLFERGHQRPFG